MKKMQKTLMYNHTSYKLAEQNGQNQLNKEKKRLIKISQI